jgi:hypothetical protein
VHASAGREEALRVRDGGAGLGRLAADVDLEQDRKDPASAIRLEERLQPLRKSFPV